MVGLNKCGHLGLLFVLISLSLGLSVLISLSLGSLCAVYTLEYLFHVDRAGSGWFLGLTVVLPLMHPYDPYTPI